MKKEIKIEHTHVIGSLEAINDWLQSQIDDMESCRYCGNHSNECVCDERRNT